MMSLSWAQPVQKSLLVQDYMYSAFPASPCMGNNRTVAHFTGDIRTASCDRVLVLLGGQHFLTSITCTIGAYANVTSFGSRD